MKNIFYMFCIFIFATCPVFADITSDAESADCTENVLGTTNGTSNLEASWTPNTLNLEWYNGNEKISSNTCNYDSGITVPATDPTRTGYTFSGWRLVEKCIINTLDTTLNGVMRGFLRNGACYYNDATYNGYKYCYEQQVNDLTTNSEWKAGFQYGTIQGTYLCSTKGGNTLNDTYSNDKNNWSANKNDLISAGQGGYCWCKLTNYKPVENRCAFVQSDVYVLTYNRNGYDYCNIDCPGECVTRLQRNSAFRSALYSLYN